MQTFADKLLDLQTDVTDAIVRMVGDNKVTIYTVPDMDDPKFGRSEQEMFQLPHVFINTTFGFNEYAVIAVDSNKLYCIGTSDDVYLKNEEFVLADLDITNLCALADCIEAIVKPID